ncbi:MAG: ComEC/Rec2 family competence protein [Gelidibacter sp.]
MKSLHFPIIKLTLCLIVGILISTYLSIPLTLIIYGCTTLFIVALVLLFISKSQLKKTIWFGMSAYLTMVCIGMLTVNVHNQRLFQDHYSKVVSVESEGSKCIFFEIREVLKPTAYHDKYVVNILKIDGEKATGKLLLNVQKDSLSNVLQVDDVLMTSTSLSKLNLPLNPYQFNFSSYLKKQYIDFQLFVENNKLLPVSSKPHTIYGYAARIRSIIDEKLKNYNFENDELAMIDALLLGQRKDISQDTYNSYVNAGAIHILAVSGLHVGIVLLLFNRLFQPIERLKSGKTLKIILLVTTLWGFAIIAGLSPSVTRAVAMFTVVAIGMNLKRPTNIYNTLAISMFFLLLFKPRFLFDVGFQMSYLAVISIVGIQPFIKKLWTPTNKVALHFWGIFTVTLSAQIGDAYQSLLFPSISGVVFLVQFGHYSVFGFHSVFRDSDHFIGFV